MKTVAIINLKGGVAKTTTAVSLAELLAEGDKRRKRPGSRVLLFDNDKQGNASRIFGTYEREQEAGACRIIKTGRIAGNIRDTEVENMDIVTCNYFMELAELEIKADTVNTQHGRYKSALGEIDGKYDFCIIDNPPDLGMNVINAMVAAGEPEEGNPQDRDCWSCRTCGNTKPVRMDVDKCRECEDGSRYTEADTPDEKSHEMESEEESEEPDNGNE